MADEDARAKRLEAVKKEVRAVIESVKGGVSAKDFTRDYQMISYSQVPYKEFGCKTVEEFLSTVLSDTVDIQRSSSGETVYKCHPHEKTAKLASLVSKQKSSKKKAGKGKPSKFAMRRPAASKTSWGVSPRPSRTAGMLKPTHVSVKRAPLLPTPLMGPILVQKPALAHVIPVRPVLVPTVLYNASDCELINPLLQSSKAKPVKRPPLLPTPQTNPILVQKPAVPHVIPAKPVQTVQYNTSGRYAREIDNSIKVVIRNPQQIKFGAGFEVPPRFKKQRETEVSVVVEPELMKKRNEELINDNGIFSKAVSRVLIQKQNDDVSTFDCDAVDKDYKSPLMHYAQSHHLSRPVYETFTVGSKGRHQGYACFVTIKGRRFNGEGVYRTKKDSEHAAAMMACAELGIKLDGSAASSPDKSTSEGLPVDSSADIAMLRDRVKQLVERRPNGLWKNRLVIEYRDTFQSEAPSNLLELLPLWSDIVRIENVYGTEKQILYPAIKPAVKLTSSLTQSPSVFKIKDAVLPAVGLSSDLNSMYNSRGAPKQLQQPQVGDYCVTRYTSDDDQWYRAQIMSVDDNKENKEMLSVQVYYIDYGNENSVGGHQVLRILENMCKEPAQAIRCSLDSIFPLSESKQWNDACVDEFQRMCLNKEMKMKVLSTMSLTLPAKAEWDVYVCLVLNTTDVIIRLVDYADSLEALEKQMESLWQAKSATNLKLHKEQVCVARVEEDGEPTYNRVRIVELQADKAKVNLLDHGGTDEIELSCLTPLPSDVNVLPYQALSCKLTGLEAFKEDFKVVEKLVDLAYGKTLVADVNERLDTVSLTLWDTSTDLDININEKVAQVLSTEELRPSLPEVRDTVEGYVSYVSDAGHAFLHVQGPGMTKLEEIMNDLHQFYSQDRSAEFFVSSVLPGKLYIVKHAEDGMWYRAHVIGPSPGRKVKVLLVDYGITAIIHISSLRELPPQQLKSYHEITSLPHQAVKCCFLDLPPRGGSWTHRAVEYVRNLIPSSQVTIEVMHKPESEESGLPEVEIFISEESGENTAVTETMLDNSDLFYPDRSPEGSVAGDSDGGRSSSQASLSDLSSIADSQEEAPSTNTAQTAPVSEPSASPDSSCTNDAQQQPVSKRPSVTFDLQDRVIEVENISDVVYTENGDVDSLTVAGDNSELSVEITDSSVAAAAAASDDVLSATEEEETPGQVSVSSGDEIYITWAADPSNFRMIPQSSMLELQQMMTELDVYCREQPQEAHVSVGSLVLGQLYAACYDDCWYRVVLKNIILAANKVSLHFVDYGDYNIVSSENLFHLPKQFRKLPYQAIKASLAGVRPDPDKGEWTEEVNTRFSELVLDKGMVAWTHSTNEHGFVSVTLVNCISDPLVHQGNTFIHRVLLEEGLAVKADQ